MALRRIRGRSSRSDSDSSSELISITVMGRFVPAMVYDVDDDGGGSWRKVEEADGGVGNMDDVAGISKGSASENIGGSDCGVVICSHAPLGRMVTFSMEE